MAEIINFFTIYGRRKKRVIEVSKYSSWKLKNIANKGACWKEMKKEYKFFGRAPWKAAKKVMFLIPPPPGLNGRRIFLS